MARTPLAATLRHIHRFAGAADGPTLTDAQLLQRFVTGRDESAFAELVGRHGRMVLGVCRQVLSQRQDAEDAFQATFLVLARKAGSVRQGAALPAWLYGVAHRIAVNARRAAGRRRTHERKAVKVDHVEPDLSVAWRELQAVLADEVRRLPEKFRAPFVLCCLEGQGKGEAAARLGWKEATVSWRLAEARKRLQTRLARRGITLAAALCAGAASSAEAAVPPAAVRAVLNAAVGSAAGLPARVVRLANEVTRTMFTTQAKLATALTLALGLAATGAGARLHTGGTATPADPPPAAEGRKADAAAPAAESFVVTGRVLGPDGKPFKPGAVQVFAPAFRQKPPRSDEDVVLLPRCSTDADGRFRLEIDRDLVRPSDGPPVVAAADGYGVDWAAPRKPGEELTLKLVKDQPITGRVLDGEGRPVADAAVRVVVVYGSPAESLDAFLTGWKANWQEAIWRNLEKRAVLPSHEGHGGSLAKTDRDGRFRITGMGVERLAVLEIKAPVVAAASLHVVVRAGFDPKPYNQAADARMPAELRRPNDMTLLYGPAFEFVAAPGKTLTGVVRDADGRPVAGAGVLTIIGRSTSIHATADAAGRFTLTGLSKQPTYNLHVGPGKNSPLLARSVVVADTEGLQPVSADVTLVRGVVVTGRVIDEQTGRGVLSSVRFAPLPENKSFDKPGYDSYKHERLGTGTDPDGRFSLPVIPGPGVFIVQANSGEALDGQYLSPYLNATFDEEGRKHVKVRSDGYNQYFTGVGNSFESLDNEHAVKYLDLAEDAGTVTVDFHLRRGKTAKLTIQDPDGRPLAGAVVSGVTAHFPTTYLLKSANCPVYALNPEKPRTLAIYHPGRNLGGQVVVRGDETEPIVAKLGPAGTVTGRILDVDGQPVADGTVIISFPTHTASALDRYLQQQRPPIRTDPDGRFKVEGVVPGLKFAVNNVRKGNAVLVPKPRTGLKEVGSGATLELGEVRVEPFRRG
jgi:RNA polymerase sigma factor (sigma-70 family)